MNEILAFYHKQAQAASSSIPWLASLQEDALHQLGSRGFPDRFDEEWKYTRVEDLLKQFFVQQSHRSSSPAQLDAPIPLQALILHNGFIEGLDALRQQLPPQVLIMPLFQALIEQAPRIKPYLGKILQQEHGFHFLNTAMMHFGVFIYIPAGISVEQPIALTHFQDETQALHLRHLVIAEPGSQATLVEEYRGQEACSYFINTITEIYLGDEAQLKHYSIQRESKRAYHIGQVAVKQASKSHFSSHSLNLGGKLTRSDLNIRLQGEFADCLMNGIYAPGSDQHIDHHTQVCHLVPNCRSVQDYKGILAGKSRAVFNGKVFVAKNAQGSDAKQQNKNILLSSDAEIDSKPQLEIFADDVLCTHGATVGQLDEDALFYLMTRGISKAQAVEYLIQAFAAENLRLIPDQNLADWMNYLLRQQMEQKDE